MQARIRQTWCEFIGDDADGNRLLILDGGLKLSAIGASAIPAGPQEGMIRKGGINREPSRVATRPAPPAPMASHVPPQDD
jgi:hypothetical protein